MRFLLPLSVLAALLVAVGGCFDRDDSAPYAAVSEREQRHGRELEELRRENERLLSTQQEALAQLSAERAQSARLQAESKTVWLSQGLMSTTLVLLGCGLAVTFFVLLRRRAGVE